MLCVCFFKFSNFSCDLFLWFIGRLRICYSISTYVHFPDVFLLWFIISLCLDQEYSSYDFCLLKLLRIILWITYSISWIILHVHIRKMCILLLFNEFSLYICISFRSSWFMVLFKSSVFIMIFCPVFYYWKCGIDFLYVVTELYFSLQICQYLFFVTCSVNWCICVYNCYIFLIHFLSIHNILCLL